MEGHHRPSSHKSNIYCTPLRYSRKPRGGTVSDGSLSSTVDNGPLKESGARGGVGLLPGNVWHRRVTGGDGQDSVRIDASRTTISRPEWRPERSTHTSQRPWRVSMTAANGPSNPRGYHYIGPRDVDRHTNRLAFFRVRWFERPMVVLVGVFSGNHLRTRSPGTLTSDLERTWRRTRSEKRTPVGVGSVRWELAVTPSDPLARRMATPNGDHRT